ncbi:MAG: hypothetical protein Q9208_007512 [Pyrenodesmia sp. 3 TL-2023]
MDFLHRDMGIIHTDIKDTNILFDLTSHGPDYPQDYWIQQLFDHVPVPTGTSFPTFDYVQSKSIFAPVEDPSHLLEHVTGRSAFRGESLRDQLAQIAACLGSFPEHLTGNVVTSEHLFDLGQTCEPSDGKKIDFAHSGVLTSEQLFNPDGALRS